MPKPAKAALRPKRRVTPTEQSRIDAARALRAGVKREKEIQRLVRALDRELTKADIFLAEFARQWITRSEADLAAKRREATESAEV